MWIDFSNPYHQAYVLEELGGLEHLEREFPELYSNYLQAVRRDTQRSAEPAQTEEPDAFEDAVDIFYGFYNRENHHMVFKGVTSIKNQALHISQRVHVYQENGVLLIATGEVRDHCHHAVLSMDTPLSLTESQEKCTMVFDFFSLWYEEGVGLRAGYYSAEDSLSWNSANYIQKVTVLDPVHKKTSQDSPIVVCYNRTSQTGENIDYDQYEEAFDPVTNRQRLYLDVGAQVELTPEARPFLAVDVTKLQLKLDCQSGIAEYKKEDRVQQIMDSFQPTETGFDFHLDKDWKDVVPAARLPMREPVDLIVQVEFLTENGKRGRFTIESGSRPAQSGSYVVNISQLYFLWGCVADITPVRMKDGSVKPARQVQIGDAVAMASGAGIVKDVIVGREEEPLCCICTRNGKQVWCTKLHPVLTQRGFVTAEELTGADQVMDWEAGLVPIEAIYPVVHRDVVNFSIQPEDPSTPDATLICNGLVVGDYQLQCQCTEATAQKTSVPTQPEGEWKKLSDYFKGVEG